VDLTYVAVRCLHETFLKFSKVIGMPRCSAGCGDGFRVHRAVPVGNSSLHGRWATPGARVRVSRAGAAAVPLAGCPVVRHRADPRGLLSLPLGCGSPRSPARSTGPPTHPPPRVSDSSCSLGSLARPSRGNAEVAPMMRSRHATPPCACPLLPEEDGADLPPVPRPFPFPCPCSSHRHH
jgi:hypothetical protein